MKLKKYKNALIVLIFIFLLTLSACIEKESNSESTDNVTIIENNSDKSDEKTNIVNNNKMNVEEVAKDFILHVFSDFSDNSKKINDFIYNDSSILLEFINDRKEIIALQKDLTGRDYSPNGYEMIEKKSTNMQDGLTEVLMKIQHSYLTGGNEAFMEVIYKVIIDENNSNSVVAAMSNDISAVKLLGYQAKGYEELYLNYQLKPNEFEKPYNLAESKNLLIDLNK